MNSNNELTREDIAIDRDMDVDCDIGQEITAYIETWFNVDKKFGTDTSDDDVWLNMYAKYNPFKDTLRIECEIDKPLESEYFDYEPTESESQFIKEMIAEKIKECYDQTSQEFCDSAYNEDISIGGIK